MKCSNESANNASWEVSYNYHQFGKLDWLICHQELSFKEFFFPVLENDVVAALASNKVSKRHLGRLDRCRLILQCWIHELIDRSSGFSPEVQKIVYDFLSLPKGPAPGQLYSSLATLLLCFAHCFTSKCICMWL